MTEDFNLYILFNLAAVQYFVEKDKSIDGLSTQFHP